MSFSASSMFDGIEDYRVEKETKVVLQDFHKRLNDCDLRIAACMTAISELIYRDDEMQSYALFLMAEVIVLQASMYSSVETVPFSLFVGLLACGSMFVGKLINARVSAIREANILKWEGVKSIQDEKLEFESNLERFEAFTKISEGKYDDIVAHIGRKFFQI